jgi:hypothetical protein
MLFIISLLYVFIFRVSKTKRTKKREPITKSDKRNRNYEPSPHLPVCKIQMIHSDSLTVDWIFFQGEKYIYVGEKNADDKVVV